MLTAIREKTQGIIATFIIALIVIPFALWGTYSYFSGGPDINVAEVDGTGISQQQYRLAIDRLLARNVDPAVLNNPTFKRQVLDGLIDQALLVRNNFDQGYRVSDTELARMIRTAREFQSEGRFDPFLYERALRQQGMSEQTFEERLRTVQIASQIQSGLTESALLLSADKDAVIRLWTQQREFDYVIVGSARFISTVQVSDDSIKQYYEAHPEEFKTPEQMRIEYIQLSVDELGGEFTPTEGDLRAAYDEEIARYTIPEQRRISHILVELADGAGTEDQEKALKQAQEIEKQLRDGADFATLAKERSADSGTAAKGGDLGFVGPGTLPRELEQALSKLKAGDITEPVKTSYGYHIATITGYKASTRKTFEQVRDDLEQVLRQRQGEELFYEKFEQLSNLVYEHPDSLAPAAEALEIKVEHSDWFDRDGGKGISANAKIVEAAFSPEVLLESRNSEAIELGSDRIVALRVLGHREAQRKPLDEVRGQIQTKLQKQQARAEATRLGKETLAALGEGRSLAELANSNGLNLERVKVSRLDPKTVDPRVVAAVFKARRPTADNPVYGDVDLQDTGYGVFVLKAVEDNENPEAADSALVRRIDRILQERRGPGVYRDYLSRLRETADIKVFPDKL
ncbi:MAG: SurA N-terminal domain-containing protein [Acidiferrobacterales bacterium]